MISNRTRIRGIAVLLLLITLFSCAPAKTVRTAASDADNIQGTYTLVLYGGNYGGDLETVAFLDREDDAYILEPYAPDFVFRGKKGLAAEKALKEAGHFIGSHPDYHGMRRQAIVNDKGEVIGYEIRPLYFPVSFGTDDVLDINYKQEGSRVLVFIKLSPAVEKMKKDLDSDSR